MPAKPSSRSSEPVVPATSKVARRAAAGRGGSRPAQPDRSRNILLAAEKLFGLRGYHAVSIRDIAAEANVPLALVGYYYGAKQELYLAIFESWRESSSNRLTALKDALDEPDLAARLDRILDAFVSPLIELHQHPEGPYYALMAARDLAAPTPEADRVHREYFDPLAAAFIDALMTTVPHASRGQVAWCYQFMLGALLHFLTDRRVERLSGGTNQAADPQARPQLLAFIAGGFRTVLASPSPSPGAPRSRRRA